MLAMLLVGTALGLLWILNDIAFTQGVVGWILFILIGLPVYVAATLIWEKAFLPDREEPSVGAAISWKRVGAGLFVALGTIFVASGVYFLVKGF